MNNLADRINKIEEQFEELNSEIETQIQKRLSAYYATSSIFKLFSKNKRTEEAYRGWISVKNDIHSILPVPERHSELPAALNLYALNSAILATILDNPVLAQKAEKIRILAEEVRNRRL